jgi:hypothetical protein
MSSLSAKDNQVCPFATACKWNILPEIPLQQPFSAPLGGLFADHFGKCCNTFQNVTHIATGTDTLQSPNTYKM